MNEIFISYNYPIRSQAAYLTERLSRVGLKVFRQDKYLESSDEPLSAQLANEILESKIFVCCITNDYCESINCNNEI